MPLLGGINFRLRTPLDGALVDEYVSLATANVLDVHVPCQPSRQFWLKFSCVPKPLLPPLHPPTGKVRYYYFKVYVAGKCVMSWGVGKSHGWEGEAAFGLFDGGTDFVGKRVVEKRGLFFPSEKAGIGVEFEVRVWRAAARKRDTAQYERFPHRDVSKSKSKSKVVGIEMAQFGRVHKKESQRFYTYALRDATDEPYLKFRYHVCSQERFNELMGPPTPVSSPVLRPRSTSIGIQVEAPSEGIARDETKPPKRHARRIELTPIEELCESPPKTGTSIGLSQSPQALHNPKLGTGDISTAPSPSLEASPEPVSLSPSTEPSPPAQGWIPIRLSPTLAAELSDQLPPASRKIRTGSPVPRSRHVVHKTDASDVDSDRSPTRTLTDFTLLPAATFQSRHLVAQSNIDQGAKPARTDFTTSAASTLLSGVDVNQPNDKGTGNQKLTNVANPQTPPPQQDDPPPYVDSVVNWAMTDSTISRTRRHSDQCPASIGLGISGVDHVPRARTPPPRFEVETASPMPVVKSWSQDIKDAMASVLGKNGSLRSRNG